MTQSANGHLNRRVVFPPLDSVVVDASDGEILRSAHDFIAGRWSDHRLEGCMTSPRKPPRGWKEDGEMNGTSTSSHLPTDEDSTGNLSFKSARSEGSIMEG